MSKEEAMKELEIFIPRIANFVDVYVQDSGQEMAPPPRNGRKNVENWNGTICAIHDLEENIWTPQLGMKGKVDVTVEVKISRHKKELTKVSRML
jgi:DNA replication ATP-dependent helicase Dna2